MIQANKNSKKMLLNKEEATRYVVRVFHVNPDGYPLRDAPEKVIKYTPRNWAKSAKTLPHVGYGYEVLHDPTIKPKRASKVSEEK